MLERKLVHQSLGLAAGFVAALSLAELDRKLRADFASSLQLRARPAKSAAGAQRIVVARAAPASQTATPEVKEAVSHLRYERGSALKVCHSPFNSKS